MLYDDDFIITLPEDPRAAILAVISRLQGCYNVDDLVDLRYSETDVFTSLFDARELIFAIMAARHFSTQFDLEHDEPPQLIDAMKRVAFACRSGIEREKVENRRERLVKLLDNTFHYQLSDADVQRIQNLVNELRDEITTSTKFEAEHRDRLLRRLETLQGEIHKRISNLDRFYGLIGDAGVMLGKLGRDAKPFADRIREIVEIVWRSQASAEQLPASAKPALISSEHETTSE